MQNVIDALRDIIGDPVFYRKLEGSQNYNWDYGAMIEYAIAGILVIVVVASIFKILKGWICG